MQVTFYFDYTCEYCYRAHKWLLMVQSKTHDLELTWATFSLKEANSDDETPSVFEDRDISSLSVLALALSHAAREANFDRYHRSVFDALHLGGERLKASDLLNFAADAKVDVGEFNARRSYWLAQVEREHNEAVTKWSVFGTPTLVIDNDIGVWLKLADSPSGSDDALDLWRSLCTLCIYHPDLIEIKRST
jgi:predicted DsbA family dithiol-disulfide isomerase